MAVDAVSSLTDTKSRVSQYWLQLRYEHLVAGVAGGVVSTLVVHPFDLLKIRLSVNDGKEGRPLYRGLRHAARTIMSSEGIRGLYRGVTPNCIGSGSAWGLYFVFYNATKTFMNGGDQSIHLGPVKHMQAAVQSGILTLLFTNPIFVVKTRMCLRYGGSGSAEYGNLIRAVSTIHRKEGLLGFYKGLVPGLFGTTHGAVQFMIYEELKKLINKKKLSTMEFLLASSSSKVAAVICTYPYQVVRARMQDQHRSYAGSIDVIRQTFRREGITGFYKGISANILRVTPASAVTFLVYENVVAGLKGD